MEELLCYAMAAAPVFYKYFKLKPSYPNVEHVEDSKTVEEKNDEIFLPKTR